MPDTERQPRPFLARLRDRFVRRATVRFDSGTDAIIYSPGGLHVRELTAGKVARVEAGNRDSVGYETVFLFFHVDDEPTLAVAESDQGFAAFVAALSVRFPGTEGWQQAIPPVAYQLTSVDLWLRDAPGAEVPAGAAAAGDPTT